MGDLVLWFFISITAMSFGRFTYLLTKEIIRTYKGFKADRIANTVKGALTPPQIRKAVENNDKLFVVWEQLLFPVVGATIKHGRVSALTVELPDHEVYHPKFGFVTFKPNQNINLEIALLTSRSHNFGRVFTNYWWACVYLEWQISQVKQG